MSDGLKCGHGHKHNDCWWIIILAFVLVCCCDGRGLGIFGGCRD